MQLAVDICNLNLACFKDLPPEVWVCIAECFCECKDSLPHRLVTYSKSHGLSLAASRMLLEKLRISFPINKMNRDLIFVLEGKRHEFPEDHGFVERRQIFILISISV